MNIDIKDTITLSDDKEYVVVSKVKHENKTYYFILDINDKDNIRICVEKKFYLVDVSDEKLKNTLLPLFMQQAKEELEKMQNNQ